MKQFELLPKWVQDESEKVSQLSRASYGTKGYVLPSCHLVENKKTDTQCYVWSENSIIYVIFRGTEKNMRDIATDISAFKRHIPYDHTGKIRVHRGFYKAYNSVRDMILAKIYCYKNDGAHSIIIGGHSLGGALATLCAVDIDYNDLFHGGRLRVYTDGEPKVGNRHFKRSYNKRISMHYRCTNPLDIVPKVPFFASHNGIRIKTGHRRGHNIDHYILNKS